MAEVGHPLGCISKNIMGAGGRKARLVRGGHHGLDKKKYGCSRKAPWALFEETTML